MNPIKEDATMTKKEALKRVRKILLKSVEEHGEAIILTADRSGIPHGSWMGTMSSPNITTLFTITSPDSRKVVNVLENPNVEWMFTSSEREEVAYLRGKARIVSDPEGIESAWKQLKDKTRAYFMKYFDQPGMKFLILETKVNEIEYTVPKENVYKRMKPPFS